MPRRSGRLARTTLPLALVLAGALTMAACGGSSSGGSGGSGGNAGSASGKKSSSKDQGGGGSSQAGGGAKSGGGSLSIKGVDVTVHGTGDASSGHLTVELDDNYFKPTVITGKPGQKVHLELENEGQAQHNLSVGAQGIDKDVAAGQKIEVTVAIPKSGSLPFTCKYHTALGMSGLLKAG